MPFVEIKPPTDFIRIKDGGCVTISISLYRKYFEGKHIKVFHDEEAKKIGLKPDDDGYKISERKDHKRIKCISISRVVVGEFYPKWSSKHKMLVFSY